MKLKVNPHRLQKKTMSGPNGTGLRKKTLVLIALTVYGSVCKAQKFLKVTKRIKT